MNRIFAFIGVLLFAISAFTAESKTVSYKSGDETVQGILYTPQAEGRSQGSS